MGQQQLLLLVLSAIIVGISIVVGINMFGESALQANQDAVMGDVLTIATRAQGWYRKPLELGGGGRTFVLLVDSSSIKTLLNFEPSNANGSYQITTAGNATQFEVTGTGVEGSPLTIALTVFADSLLAPVIAP